MTQLAENKELVLTFFRRLEAGDVLGAFELFAPDGTCYSASTRKARTASQLAEANVWFFSHMVDGVRFDIGLLTAEEDRVSVTAESHAELDNGRPYNNVYNFLFEIADGQIRKMSEYNDSLHVATQLEGLPGYAEARAGTA